MPSSRKPKRGYVERATPPAGWRSPERKELSGGQESAGEIPSRRGIDAIVTVIELDIISITITITIIFIIITAVSTAAPRHRCSNLVADACKGYNHNESFIETACQHLLLLVGIDILTYRRYYDTPPILVGHQDYFLAPLPGSEALLRSSLECLFGKSTTTAKVVDEAPGIAMDEVRKKLFSVSLSGKAAHWYKLLDNGDSLEWNDIVPRFYSKFYPPSEIHKDRNRIYNFWPHEGESIAQAWGRLKSLMLKCPIHELPGNIIIDNFYARLSFQDKTLLDTSCSGSFTRNKEEFKRDLLNRIQENTEGWENDKDRESGINYDYKCIEAFMDTDKFRNMSATYGLDSQVAANLYKAFASHYELPKKNFDKYHEPYKDKIDSSINKCVVVETVDHVIPEAYIEKTPFPAKMKEYSVINSAVHKSEKKPVEPEEQIKVEPAVAIIKDLVTENVEDGHIIFCEDASNIVSHPNKSRKASVPMLSVRIGDHCYYGLCDIGASISAIPYELYTEIMHEIGSCELEDIDVVIRLANRETISPIGIIRDVEVLCAAGGTFMSITLGAATKLLDDMMINYSEWHTERAPQGKKVNSVEETSSLSDKIDVIMSMLVNGRSNIDPNNVPLASLVAQEENVDVNFIKNNNFNNNAYRNNSGNNYRPYPSANGNGYGNSYGNSYNNNRNVPSGLEAMLKEFISTQTAFNKSVEEKLDKIDTIASRVDRLASDVNILKLKVMPNNDIDNKITTTANAIQVRINENIRLMAELRARWDREENEKLAKENNVAKVWTITTTSNANSPHVAAPPTINGNIIGVGNVSTPSAKRTKLPETAKTAETACDRTAEIFSNLGNNDPIAVAHNDLDFDDCHISEVIKFLQKLAKSPNASAINLAFTKHITNALIKAREEKLKLETSIPRKLEDGWEPIIKMKFNDFECNALCDLGASISVMPKKIYDMLDLPPLKNYYLDVNLADNVKKKPLGRIDNVHITVNNNLVPVDFVVLDIECNASCPIVLGRPFLRTVGAVIDMREGNIKYQFPLKKGMEHFPRKRMKLPFDSIIRTSYDVDASTLDVT
ncbi:hypothetical protein QYE76_058177 [Lolium multiflorum]|uniref:Retrotransposon gag domain-containing protein n=1 Tax=Lolium multiflorum TaxID=4521 RepID=A0AAD8T4Z7_LOLMU|nr:hypothetical protein QYE76_058177 [Lolium multiflorum]